MRLGDFTTEARCYAVSAWTRLLRPGSSSRSSKHVLRTRGSVIFLIRNTSSYEIESSGSGYQPGHNARELRRAATCDHEGVSDGQPVQIARVMRRLVSRRRSRRSDGLESVGQSQLHRSSLALVVTTAVNGLLGLAFWITAARSYSPGMVGLGAGGISAMQLVGTVGWAGLQFTILRYLPAAGPHKRLLLAYLYGAGGAAVVLCAMAMVAFGTNWFGVRFISANTLGGIVFCVSAIVWFVFSLQDAALVAVRRSVWVPVENALYGVSKLGLLIIFASVNSPWTIFGVWVGASLVMAAAVNTYLFTQPLAPALDSHSDLPSRSVVAIYSTGQTGTALLAWIPEFLVPLLVIRLLGQRENAYYYAAWTIGYSMRLISINMSNVLITEAAHDRAAVPALLRSSTRLAAVVLIPAMLVGLAVPGVILGIFGSGYEAGASLLRYYAISLVPFSIAGVVIAIDRISGKFGTAMLITGTGTVVTLALDLLLMPNMGISGAGLGWLLGQTVAAAVAVASYRFQARRPAGDLTPQRTHGKRLSRRSIRDAVRRP